METNLGLPANSNLIALGYISFLQAGSNTTILLDRDAAGAGFVPRPYITVNSIAPAALNVSANFIF